MARASTLREYQSVDADEDGRHVEVRSDHCDGFVVMILACVGLEDAALHTRTAAAAGAAHE